MANLPISLFVMDHMLERPFLPKKLKLQRKQGLHSVGASIHSQGIGVMARTELSSAENTLSLLA